MRRSTQVLLVLMGGGMVAASVVPALRRPECEPAQQVNGACPTSSGAGRSSTYSGWSSSASDSTAGRSAGDVAGATSRGGFGATGAALASSGG